VHRRLLATRRLPGLRDLEFERGLSSFILALTAGYFALSLISLAAWRITGDDRWVVDFFRLPGAVILVTLAGFEVTLCWRVTAEFSPGHSMRKAWKLIMFSAAFDLAGALGTQICGIDSPLNPLRLLPQWSQAAANTIGDLGNVIGGPCRFACLAAGLFWTLRVYRRSGFLGRLAPLDWAALALVLVYIVDEARRLIHAIEAGKHPRAVEIMHWPVDPLLWVLLLEGLLLYRSVRKTGTGLIGRCWRAFSIGIALITLGDIGIWASNYGFLPWPWSSLEWYVWIPAAGAFAMAPVFQLEAIQQAKRSRGRTPWGPEQKQAAN
jgi:hypothetical protein